MNSNNNAVTVGKILLKQLNSSWNMLQQAINKVTNELWSETVNEWSFSWTVYHIIETADFYSRGTPESMEWGKKADINWNTDTETIIADKKSKITKKGLTVYLKEVEERLSTFLGSSTDTELLENDGFEWFNSILEKQLYLLRHNMHHIGELNKTLRGAGCARINWT